jgi:hypothetical protein
MMKAAGLPRRFGKVIAKRALSIKGSRKKVEIELGTPQVIDDGRTVYCAYRISQGGRRIKQMSVGGVDGFQALRLSINLLCVDLEYLFKINPKAVGLADRN